MTEEEYNGWTNRETWAIQLHLSNNEGDYNHMREVAVDFLEIAQNANGAETDGEGTHDQAVNAMAEYIKTWTEEVFEMVVNPEDGPANENARTFVSDVGSWWRADFYEIAEHWIDEAGEELS